MTDYDYEAIAAGLKLIRKANRAIDARRYGYGMESKPGADWHVAESVSGYEGTPTYVGSHGKAALYATEDGTSYEVNVFSFAGKLAHRVTRKTLDAAFKIGQKLANEELPSPAPKVVEPASVVDEPAEPETVKAKRGDLVVLEMRPSYTTSSYAREEVTEYRLMMVTNLTRAGEIKMVSDVKYGDDAYSVKLEGMLHATGRWWLLPATMWDVRAAIKIAREHVYPNSTTPRAFQSLEAAWELLAPTRVGYVAPAPVVDEPAAEDVTEPVANASFTPCTALAQPGNIHFMTVHCVECNAFRLAKMNVDQVEQWYRSGHFSQDEFEAYMYAWATSAVRYSAGGWAVEPTDPKVIEIVAAIRRHAGIPAPVVLTA